MRLSPHFTLSEFTKSQTAERKGIDNTPAPIHIKCMETLCINVLEPIRVVEQAIQSATETAVMILRIDDVISSKGVAMGDEMGDMGDFHM